MFPTATALAFYDTSYLNKMATYLHVPRFRLQFIEIADNAPTCITRLLTLLMVAQVARVQAHNTPLCTG